MCHVVAGYPSEKQCVELLLKMQSAGIRTIEVQIPFSDPIADGETIMIANDKAIEHGMTTKKSFDLIKAARKLGLKADIYIMSYTQKLVSFDIENFCKQAHSACAKGLIVPDLPIEAEEYSMLSAKAGEYSLEIVPVVSPDSSEERLNKSIDTAGQLIYLTSTKGITGNKLKLNKPLIKTAKEIKRQKPDAKLAIGFGIETKQDVEAILRIADMAVLGSSVIRKIEKSGSRGAIDFINQLFS